MDRGLYDDKTSVPYAKQIAYKFFVDAGNQPTVPANPLNLYIASIVWVSQGLYRITFMDGFKNLVGNFCTLNVNGAGVARWAQPGAVGATAAGAVTLDIQVVDNAGAVQNPAAANANNFISGVALFCDVSTV